MSLPIQLDIEGMTCASCANRIEKALNKVEGVEASVNYATERATVVAAGVPADVLLRTIEDTGYRASVHTSQPVARDPHETTLVRRLVVSAALTIPVLVLSMVPAVQFSYWQWVVTALAVPVVVWGAWPFHRAAAINARHGVATMDTLISLGVAAAAGWSIYALTLGGAGMPGMTMTVTLIGTPGAGRHEIYWEVAAAVTTFMLLGRYLEHRAKRDAGAALRALMESGAKEATLLVDGVETIVPIQRVVIGDQMVVKPGDRIPTDGVVLEGMAAIDTSMMTGESMPREVQPGDQVLAGYINTSGRLVIEASRVGADTELVRMARLVEQAQVGKSQAQRLADSISGVFVPIVIAIALVAFVGWLVLGGPLNVALQAAVATLIIACPCALGLATPTALLVGTGRGAQLGLLIRGPEALELSRSIDTVIVDKTGTLTTGHMSVLRVHPAPGRTESEVIALAAAVEAGSLHPLAKAIVDYRETVGAPALEAIDFKAVPGRGQRARVAGSLVAVGQPGWMGDGGFDVGPDLAAALATEAESGHTVVAVGSDGVVVGLCVISDTLKDSSPDAVARLRALGLEPVMATGDAPGVAWRIAAEVGIERVYSEMTPEGKADLVSSLQESGHRVAMVGDGINDALALARANLGIAMGTGTDAAMTAGDLTVVNGDLRGVADAIRLARRTLSTIRGNLFWAFAYNVAAIPLAVMALLNPIVAGLAMAFSSVFVVTNSLRLRGFRPTSSPQAH